MPAKDLYHDHVRNALIKEGWTITHDPLRLRWRARKKVLIDLAAEKMLVATKGQRKIAVEVKSFVGMSELDDLYNAIGQFILYRTTLATQAPDRELFLAIRIDVYEQIFTDPMGELLRQEAKLKLIVFDAEKQEIIKWIE